MKMIIIDSLPVHTVFGPPTYQRRSASTRGTKDLKAHTTVKIAQHSVVGLVMVLTLRRLRRLLRFQKAKRDMKRCQVLAVVSSGGNEVS